MSHLRAVRLGVEVLEWFVSHKLLYRIHKCVFGAFALENEPVDPRR